MLSTIVSPRLGNISAINSLSLSLSREAFSIVCQQRESFPSAFSLVKFFLSFSSIIFFDFDFFDSLSQISPMSFSWMFGVLLVGLVSESLFIVLGSNTFCVMNYILAMKV